MKHTFFGFKKKWKASRAAPHGSKGPDYECNALQTLQPIKSHDEHVNNEVQHKIKLCWGTVDAHNWDAMDVNIQINQPT